MQSLVVPPGSRGLLPEIEGLARAAGALVMDIYAGDFEVLRKGDASPVTQADRLAESLIVPALLRLQPPWPVVAEEAAAQGHAPEPAETFWLVDPLDGTREFVARNGEFTVNIALVHQGRPVLGVVYLPASGLLYAGAVGQGAWREFAGDRRSIHARPCPPEGPTLACSRSHGDDAALTHWLAGKAVAHRVLAGSSLKFGLIAEGRADLYPRFGRTMEWDTAAGQAVLEAAGGRVCGLDGLPLRYGKPGYENPHFVATGTAPAAPG